MTCLAHLPPSSFALHLTPTSHCASLTCPSKFSLSCFGPLSRSIGNPCLYSLGSCCLLSVALQSSHCHLVSTSLPAVGTALLPAVGTALSSRILGFRPWLFFIVLHVRLVRLSPVAGCDRVYCFSLQARIADFFLLCRFLVSARACLSRSFVSSRPTATCCSSSSLSRHFRVRLLVWSAPPAPSLW